MRSSTQAVTLDTPAAHAFDFLANPENLPLWAVGFCHGIRRQEGHWIVTTTQGDVEIRFVTNQELGTVDFHISPAPGVEAVAFSRVLPNGDGAEYVFTQFQPPVMPDQVYEGQVAALTHELHILQALFRARAACRT